MNNSMHKMLCVHIYPSGAEEWYCGICSRHFIAQWEPQFERIILAEGDSTIAHSGGRGGLHIDSIEAIDEQTEKLETLLDGIDFDEKEQS